MVCVCGFSSIVDLRERFSKQSSAARAHVLTRSEPGVTLVQRTFLLTFALPLTLLLPDWFVALLVSLSRLSLRVDLPRKGQKNCSAQTLTPPLWFCLLSRRFVALVLPSVRLLLQEPQGRRRGRERHLVQRALHLQLREPVGGRLPAGDGDLRAGQPPVTPPRPNPGQAAEKGPGGHAAALRTAAQEWLAAHAHGELPRHQHDVQEEGGQREADGRGGVGKVHSRLPKDQDPREVPREEVHVAGRPAEKVPRVSQDTGPGVQTHEAKDQFTCFLIRTFATKKGENTKLFRIQSLEERSPSCQ